MPVLVVQIHDNTHTFQQNKLVSNCAMTIPIPSNRAS